MEERQGRNWWKIGFFVLLFLLEVAREIVVIAGSAEAEPIVREHFLSGDGYTSASGTWKRADGGDPLNKGGVSIRCYRARGECYEAAYNVSGLNVFEPSITIFRAAFSDDTIAFKDDSSLCMSYLTRIDLAAKQVTRVRTKKALKGDEPGLSPEMQELCDRSEDRIEMVLSGYTIEDSIRDPTEGHFVPVFSFIGWVSRAF